MPKKKMIRKTHVEKVAKKTGQGRGGRREGAGRPKGSGKYGCPTKAVRVPAHLIDQVVEFAMKEIKKEQKAQGG